MAEIANLWPFHDFISIMMTPLCQRYDDSYHGENRCARKNDADGDLIFSYTSKNLKERE
jgi:hypothetical protein